MGKLTNLTQLNTAMLRAKGWVAAWIGQVTGTVADALIELDRVKADGTALAPAYSSAATYAQGDYCTHEGQLYVCSTAIGTAEAWNAAHWTATDVAVMAGGSGGYAQTFTTSSWTTSGSTKSLTVSAATHGMGTDLIVDVWTLSGTSYVKSYGYPSTGWKVTVDSSGNVTLSTETAFAGKIVIK